MTVVLTEPEIIRPSAGVLRSSTFPRDAPNGGLRAAVGLSCRRLTGRQSVNRISLKGLPTVVGFVPDGKDVCS